MSRLRGKPDSFESAEEERVAVILEAWIRAMQENPAAKAPACLPFAVLTAFFYGRISTEMSRQILLHLSSCKHCRAQESALRKRRTLHPSRMFNIHSLRRTVGQDTGKDISVLNELRLWLTEMLIPEALLDVSLAQKSLVPDIEAEAGRQLGHVEFELERPLIIDQQGRLRINLSTTARVNGFSLAIAIQDSERRLELCAVPIKEGKVAAIVDCSFLSLPKGALSPDLLQLNLVSAELREEWGRPEILPTLEALVARQADPVEFWDVAVAVFADWQDRWEEFLCAEVARLKSPSSGLEVIRSAVEQISRYVEIWRESNQKEPPFAKDILSGLSEITTTTQPRRKRHLGTETEATIVGRREKKDQRSSSPQVKDEGEDKPTS
ncbi:MAG: hypothetical protein L0229_08850 [Blastocatellia bacterium]|nr:hypothetical protein [Blastocatellia bacterium]